MRQDKACGAVVFKCEGGEVKYYVIEQQNGVFGFPKGHVEGNEMELETARREILEETGLSVHFIDGFREEQNYYIPEIDAMKNVVCFLAEAGDDTPAAQESEIKKIYLVPFDKARSLITFDDTRKIFEDANAFLAAKA